jgi:ketosteroid isomerase-like protein
MPGVRTPQKVFQHHAESLAAADIEGIAADYGDDSILITPGGVVRGRADIRGKDPNELSEMRERVGSNTQAGLACAGKERATQKRTVRLMGGNIVVL